ncbi:MAG: hypothetical protein CL776_05760 [Chloroflexi bacterium]|nr:hypothetical protein [Chloroflexota bacterium]
MSLEGVTLAVDEAKKPKIFYGWYIVLASVLSNALLSGIVWGGFGAFIIPIETTFGWSRSAISGAMALRQLESGILAPFVGWVVDKFGGRLVIIGGAITTGLGLMALGWFSVGIISFYFFFIIVAIGTSGVSHAVTWPVIISRWFDRKKGLAVGIAVTGPTIGTTLIILNTALEDRFGWRSVLGVYGIVVILFVGLMGVIVRDRPEELGLNPDGDISNHEQLGSNSLQLDSVNSKGLTFQETIRTSSFWLLAIYLGGMFISSSGFLTHEHVYFVDDLKFNARDAAVMVTLTFAFSAIGRVGSGWLMDHMDYRVVMAAASLLMSFSFLYAQIFEITNSWLALPFILGFGISFGSNIPMRAVLASMIFGNRALGSVIGILNGAIVGAGLIGPLMLGIIYDWKGSYSIGIGMMLILCFSLSLVPMLMKSRQSLTAVQFGE